MNKKRDSPATGREQTSTRTPDEPGDPDALRPLDARSLALSALLGTHPPALPTASLVALAELFGIAAGTMRTALSRLAAAGEVTATDGRYRLAGPLLERQRHQDTGRRPADAGWDGTWHTVIAADDRRSVAERRRFRRTMVDHRFAELRPDIWMRPANLPAPAPGGDRIVITGALAVDDPDVLVDRLWSRRDLAERARRLLDRLASASGGRDDERSETGIPHRFDVAAATLRFLRSEPLLPIELGGDDDAIHRLRDAYAVVERDLQRDLASFFARHREAAATTASTASA